MVRVVRLELTASRSQIQRSSQTELHPDINKTNICKPDWKSGKLYKQIAVIVLWSGMRESNPRFNHGKVTYYLYTNAACIILPRRRRLQAIYFPRDGICLFVPSPVGNGRLTFYMRPLVVPMRIERMTPALSARCSNHLSYGTIYEQDTIDLRRSSS